jgi:hypothetical protein
VIETDMHSLHHLPGSILVAFNLNGEPNANIRLQSSSINIMSKVNVAVENTNNEAEIAEVKTLEAVAFSLMTIVKREVEEPQRLNIEEKIQKVEDLTLIIDRRHIEMKHTAKCKPSRSRLSHLV